MIFEALAENPLKSYTDCRRALQDLVRPYEGLRSPGGARLRCGPPGATFRGSAAEMEGCSLGQARLQGANLRKANLKAAQLAGADLNVLVMVGGKVGTIARTCTKGRNPQHVGNVFERPA